MLAKSAFDLQAFRESIANLESQLEDVSAPEEDDEDEYEDDDESYMIEGALENVSEQLWLLLPKSERGAFADASLHLLITELADKYGFEPDVAPAVAELERAMSSSWYEDVAFGFEAAKDGVVQKLNSMADQIEEAENASE